jgi:hypothetical protein
VGWLMFARLFERNAQKALRLQHEAEMRRQQLAAAPKPSLRQVASAAPTGQLMAIFLDELPRRSDMDPDVLREFSHVVGRWADELERNRL